MMKKWMIIGIAVFVIGLIIINLLIGRSPTIMKVEVDQISKEMIEETIITPGTLKLNKVQTIYKEAERGIIEEVFVKEGDKVEEGDVLIRYENKQLELEDKQMALQIRSLLLELDQIKSQHQAIDKEIDKNKDDEFLREEHDDISLRHKQLNIDLEQLQLQKEALADQQEALVVSAKRKGLVLALNDDPSVEEAFITIGSLNDLVVEGNVSEYDALKINREQAVILTSEAVLDEAWEGEVSMIHDLPESTLEDDMNAYYPIEVKVKDKINLKPGFKMLIEVITSERNVDTLPTNAIKQAGDKNYVYLVEKNKVKEIEVEVGVANHDRIEILSGVKENDMVIMNPSKDLVDGMEVDIK